MLRLLKGQLRAVPSRELRVTAAELSGWREAFLAGGASALKVRETDQRDEEIIRLKAKIGDLTMANELLDAEIDKLQGGVPLRLRRSIEHERLALREQDLWRRLGLPHLEAIAGDPVSPACAG